MKSLTSLNQSTSHVGLSGYVSVVEFYPTKEDLRVSSGRAALSSPVFKDGVTAMNRAAARAIGFMERREHKVLVDYNYEHLQEKQKANVKITNKLLEKGEEIKQYKKTIKQMTREGSHYLDEVRVTSNKIHDLAGATLDPTASMTVCNLKQTLLEIHDAVGALQSITSAACLSLKKGIYPYDPDSDSSFGKGYADDMGDGYNNYVRSP